MYYLALGSQIRRISLESEASLGYTVNLRLFWAIQLDSASEKNNNNNGKETRNSFKYI